MNRDPRSRSCPKATARKGRHLGGWGDDDEGVDPEDLGLPDVLKDPAWAKLDLERHANAVPLCV
jgi:hypothetical protein